MVVFVVVKNPHDSDQWAFLVFRIYGIRRIVNRFLDNQLEIQCLKVLVMLYPLMWN